MLILSSSIMLNRRLLNVRRLRLLVALASSLAAGGAVQGARGAANPLTQAEQTRGYAQSSAANVSGAVNGSGQAAANESSTN